LNGSKKEEETWCRHILNEFIIKKYQKRLVF
jgi:hypothetical protein